MMRVMRGRVWAESIGAWDLIEHALLIQVVTLGNIEHVYYE